MLRYLKNLIRKKKSQVIMIAAIQSDRGIGYKGDLIHSIKNDMKHFVEQTNGHTVIMGRKNWESIPEKYRPLKNRQNIIITRDIHYVAKGAIVVSSLGQALKKSIHGKIYIIGGGEIYNLGLEYADTLDLTIIHSEKPADVFFPKFEKKFNQISGSGIISEKKTQLNYEFQIWKRKTED